MTKQRRAIGIIRVSQVAGREGESFASPAEQRERIEAACERDGMRLVEAPAPAVNGCFEEMDMPGRTPLEHRPGLRTAIEMVEAGRADVIVGAYFDRLMRSLAVQAELVERVEQAGGQVLAVDVGRITGESAGQWLSGTMLGAVAEYTSRTAKERSAGGQRRAVERGVCPFPSIPPGYRRGDDGILVIEPREAPIVAEAFGMRARGATIDAVRDYLTANGIERTWYSTQTLLKSRIPLGQIHFGKLSNLDAHAPIVDEPTWRSAQGGKLSGTRPPSQRLLARQGVLRCGSCGSRMVVGTVRQNGGRYYLYRCPVTGECSKRMTVGADIAEGVVVEHVRAAIRNVEGRASAEGHIRAAEAALENAEQALSGAVEMLTGMEDLSATQQRLAELRADRDAARAKLEQLGGTRAAVTVFADRDWGLLTLAEQRALIRATVESACVGPGRGPGRVTVELFV
jgi:DNA invertase Pin-like site-specific DNA recombinase